MEYLPHKTLLGNIQIVEVYDFYDQPCLFLGKNNSGQHFLAIWIDELENRQVWLYVAISLLRLRELFERSIDLKDTFQHAEDGIVYEINITDDDLPDQITVIDVLDLSDEKLPIPNEYIDISEELIFTPQEKTLSRAIATRKEALDLSFNFENRSLMAAPIGLLANVLKSLQDLIDALGQSCANQVTLKGKIPNSITDQTKLLAVGSFHGSFGLQVCPSHEADFWNDSLARQAIQKFTDLLQARSQLDLLSNLLHEIQPRAASKYKVLMQHLINARSDIKVDWSSPSSQDNTIVYLTRSEIQNVIRIVEDIEEREPHQYQIVGELIGVNKRSKSFEIYSHTERQKFAGRILDSALQIAEKATISSYYNATIIETQEVAVTGEEATKYSLLNLEEIED